jgi:predicted transcriptional regulator of viral defense system
MSSKVSIVQALEESLAKEHRRVLSYWRAALIIRKATRAIPAEDRRWSNIPNDVQSIRLVLTRLVHSGALLYLPGDETHLLFQLASPYARMGQVDEEEALMELHPYAALSHISALVFHDLSDDLPKEIHVITPSDGKGQPLPIDTTSQDWEGLALVRGKLVKEVLGRPIHWHRVPFFGTAEYRPRGYPIRVTTPERTLLDGLLHPEWCGGSEHVLRAWALARDLIHLDRLVDYTEQFDIALLRQRVGFIVEELGLSHPAIEKWPALAKRGGSSKLAGNAPFSSQFNPRWNLSINVPIDVLHSED